MLTNALVQISIINSSLSISYVLFLLLSFKFDDPCIAVRCTNQIRRNDLEYISNRNNQNISLHAAQHPSCGIASEYILIIPFAIHLSNQTKLFIIYSEMLYSIFTLCRSFNFVKILRRKLEVKSRCIQKIEDLGKGKCHKTLKKSEFLVLEI